MSYLRVDIDALISELAVREEWAVLCWMNIGTLIITELAFRVMYAFHVLFTALVVGTCMLDSVMD